MSTKLWKIEQGEYSDYTVVGIFSSKKNAELFLAKMDKEGELLDFDRFEDTDIAGAPTICEIELDPHVPDIRQGMNPYLVNMDYHGNCYRVEITHASAWEAELSVWPRTKAPRWENDENVADEVKGTVWAKSPEHAAKIANEFRVQRIADGTLTFRGDPEKSSSGWIKA